MAGLRVGLPLGLAAGLGISPSSRACAADFVSEVSSRRVKASRAFKAFVSISGYDKRTRQMSCKAFWPRPKGASRNKFSKPIGVVLVSGGAEPLGTFKISGQIFLRAKRREGKGSLKLIAFRAA